MKISQEFESDMVSGSEIVGACIDILGFTTTTLAARNALKRTVGRGSFLIDIGCTALALYAGFKVIDYFRMSQRLPKTVSKLDIKRRLDEMPEEEVDDGGESTAE